MLVRAQSTFVARARGGVTMATPTVSHTRAEPEPAGLLMFMGAEDGSLPCTDADRERVLRHRLGATLYVDFCTTRSRNAVMVAKCPNGAFYQRNLVLGGPAASSWDKVLVS